MAHNRAERVREIRRRRHRRAKLQHLRRRLKAAKTIGDQEQLKEKIRRISPTAPFKTGEQGS